MYEAMVFSEGFVQIPRRSCLKASVWNFFMEAQSSKKNPSFVLSKRSCKNVIVVCKVESCVVLNYKTGCVWTLTPDLQFVVFRNR
jgi:hypothetical protein